MKRFTGTRPRDVLARDTFDARSAPRRGTGKGSRKGPRRPHVVDLTRRTPRQADDDVALAKLASFDHSRLAILPPLPDAPLPAHVVAVVTPFRGAILETWRCRNRYCGEWTHDGAWRTDRCNYCGTSRFPDPDPDPSTETEQPTEL